MIKNHLICWYLSRKIKKNRNKKKNMLSSEVLLRAVKVQKVIVQTKEVYKLRQIRPSSVHSDIWLEFIQRVLGATPPLVDQSLKLG